MPLHITLTELYNFLGAPLANQRWSWGAVRPSDSAVILRVWQDECTALDGNHVVQVTFSDWSAEHPGNLGHAERLTHLELIRTGAPAYMIMCNAADTEASPRKVAAFNDREFFARGRILKHCGDQWLERKGRRLAREVRG